MQGALGELQPLLGPCPRAEHPPPSTLRSRPPCTLSHERTIHTTHPPTCDARSATRVTLTQLTPPNPTQHHATPRRLSAFVHILCIRTAKVMQVCMACPCRGWVQHNTSESSRHHDPVVRSGRLLLLSGEATPELYALPLLYAPPGVCTCSRRALGLDGFRRRHLLLSVTLRQSRIT